MDFTWTSIPQLHEELQNLEEGTVFLIGDSLYMLTDEVEDNDGGAHLCVNLETGVMDRYRPSTYVQYFETAHLDLSI